MAATTPDQKLRGYDFYRQVCSNARYIVAPMVDGSELPWRLLSRRYGAHLAYTPMFNSGVFVQSDKYRAREFMTSPEDRPLFVQFCGDDPQTMLAAAKLVEDQCDAVDINLGCPQNIAKRGHYGSFLQDEWDLVREIVSTLDRGLKVPVTCKIRVFPTVERTVAYAKMLQDAGCSILTVHGRLREQKGVNTGLADWEKIRAVKEALSIPVFANGNILCFDDIERCLAATGADGVMSAEGNLYNPALFANLNPPAWQLADEYLALCREHPVPLSFVRGHMFKLFYHILQRHPQHREAIGQATTLDAFAAASAAIRDTVTSGSLAADAPSAAEAAAEAASEEMTRLADGDAALAAHLRAAARQVNSAVPYYLAQSYVRRLPTPEEVRIWADKDRRNAAAIAAVAAAQSEPSADTKRPHSDEQHEARKKRKEAKRAEAAAAAQQRSTRRPVTLCADCPNVAGERCEHGRCRKCCASSSLACAGHKATPRAAGVEPATVEASAA